MLPVGYLDMGREDYAVLDVETLRAVYARCREIVRYTMGKDSADSAIFAQAPMFPQPSFAPVDWIMAVKRVTCKCARCNGSGTYSWGACLNGVMQHSAPCARCNGKGQMDFDDMRRGKAYDGYAIARACRA